MKVTKYGMMILMGILLCTGCASSREEDEPQTERAADVIVGIEEENAPYCTVDENGELSGFYVDLMNALQQEEGFTYEFLSLAAADFMAEGSSCDVYLGTVVVDVDSQTEYIQSDMICETGLCLATIKGGSVESTDDLLDASVASRAETGEESFARYLTSKYYGDSIVFQNLTDVETDVMDGFSQAAVMDAVNFSFLKQEEASWKVIIESEKYVNVHCFTARSDDGIPEAIAEGLEQLQSDGTLDSLLQEYGLD